jgi:endonuclease III
VDLDHARIVARVPPVPRRDWKPASRRRVLGLRDRLRLLYGRPAAPPHRRPLDELILTVLSQSTNDRNRDVAFLRLRARFPSWQAVRDAPLDEVEAAIRPGGISKVKSGRIQAILRALDDPPSLDHLAGMDVAAARAELCGLPGVGRKTAACVLLFSFGMPDVPVDTHVSRVGTRLGLFRPGAPFEELHDDMLALTPRGQELELHVNLLRHGRRTCHAQRPQCDECALLRMCPWGMSAR